MAQIIKIKLLGRLTTHLHYSRNIWVSSCCNESSSCVTATTVFCFFTDFRLLLFHAPLREVKMFEQQLLILLTVKQFVTECCVLN